MIQVKHLRIGNIVQDVLGIDTFVVYKLDDEAITCGDAEYSHPYLHESLRGLLLSPEILEKCGFVKHVEPTKMAGIDYVDYRLGNMAAIVIPSCIEIEFAPHFETIEDRGHICSIHYLHQLQNLFWTLTGTELQINLNQ